MASALRIVDSVPEPDGVHQLLAISSSGARIIKVEEWDIPVPLVSFMLSSYYQLGGLIDTKTEYGMQLSATVSILWRGVKRTVLAAAVPLAGGPDLVLPLGTFLLLSVD